MPDDIHRAGGTHDSEAVRSLIDALPVALVGLDRNDRVTHWNPAAERLFGWTAAEVLGQPYPAISLDRRDEHQVLLDDAFKGGRNFPGVETQQRRKDGSLVDVAIWTAPLPAGGGSPSVAIGVILDLTERKKLETLLYQSQKMEAVGQLAGGIAHDFNNLITVVTGQSGLLSEDPRLPQEWRDSVAAITEAADRAALLTRQLLAFSRRQVLQARVFCINDAINEMRDMLRRLIGADVDIVTDLDQDLGHVRVDPTQFQQIVLNLAVNARDAMPDGGRLRIATSNAWIDAAMAAAFPYPVLTGGYIRLEVQDSGEGMDDLVLNRIFEPFFTTKPRGQGTGLGLSTVYGIVKQSGGYIWVDSAPAEGTTFSIYLPRVVAETPVAAVPADVRVDQAPSPSDETILLVEDEAGVRELARRVLERAGYRVLEADDGEAAIALSGEYPGEIHLLVSDVVMPGQRGPAVFRRLAAERPGLRVLFMSGYSEEVLAMDAFVTPVVSFLEKPFTPAALRQAVADSLRGGAVSEDSTRENASS